MKAVILCAGKGERAYGYTGGGNKCLTVVPSHGRILDYSLRTAHEFAEQIVILVGYKGDEVREYVRGFTKANNLKTNTIFIEQKSYNGLCDGLLCCEPALDGETFMLFLGDEMITKPRHNEMIAHFYNASAFAACGYVHAPDMQEVKKTYALEISRGSIINFVEKPTRVFNDCMGTGNCLFSREFFKYLHHYADNYVSTESPYYSFPDVLKFAISKGEKVIAHEIGKSYLNFNTADDIAAFVEHSFNTHKEK